MAFPDLFKLEKLKIEAYEERARSTRVGTFEAMFNPATLSQSFAIEYTGNAAASRPTQVARYRRTNQADLSFTLLLDGTGVDQIGLLTLFGSNPTVSDRISDFLNIAYHVVGSTHEPSFLIVTWGELRTSQPVLAGFRGRLKSLDIRYTSIDRDGSPLRAELNVALVADDDPNRQLALVGLSSPDVTHSRTVRAGDTLPLLTREIYGSSRYVLEVARVNGLDDFRSLEPGRELIFPPFGA